MQVIYYGTDYCVYKTSGLLFRRMDVPTLFDPFIGSDRSISVILNGKYSVPALTAMTKSSSFDNKICIKKFQSFDLAVRGFILPPKLGERLYVFCLIER